LEDDLLDTEDLEVQEDIAESHQAKSRSVMCGDSYIYRYSPLLCV